MLFFLFPVVVWCGVLPAPHGVGPPARIFAWFGSGTAATGFLSTQQIRALFVSTDGGRRCSNAILTVLSCLVGVDASSVFVVNPIVISVPGRMWQGRLAEQSRY